MGNTSSTPNSTLVQGTDSSAQLVSGLMFTATLFIVLFTSEAVFGAAENAASRFMTLLDRTASSEDAAIVIYQDPTKYQNAKTIGLSVNERAGIEFAYSFYIFVKPTTFNGSATYKHVFHKGYARPWPLLGPGVFIKGNDNSMRVIMNTYKNPYSFVDVRNIPIQKWFHVVLNCTKSGLDIFINGNLANRVSFDNTLPYQNFGDVFIFSNLNYNPLRGSTISSLGGEDFQIEGSFSGLMSNLKYARYALSTSEIQALLTEGPSTKMNQVNMEKPPYLADDWWASQS